MKEYFYNLTQRVRTEKEENEAWFSVPDIAAILGIGTWQKKGDKVKFKPATESLIRAISGLSEKFVKNFDVEVVTGAYKDGTPCTQVVPMGFTTQQGVIVAITRSRKKEAQAFFAWVTDVIKEILEHGGYTLGQEYLSNEDLEAFRQAHEEQAALVKKLRKENGELIREVERLAEENEGLEELVDNYERTDFRGEFTVYTSDEWN